MKITIAVVLFLIFLSLSLIHFYWVLGGKWGNQSVYPSKNDTIPPIMPGVIPTLIVAIGLLGFGFFYLIQYRFVNIALPEWLDKIGFWIIATIFIVRAIGDFNYIGFFKKHKKTKFSINDTKYYSPLCLLIGVLTLLLQVL